jgi:NAD(P)-dependent dehydrogenase (short-subunit alcohol dehydrogenase family)
MSVALITGGSAGLGQALVEALTAEDWTVITDARDGDRLAAVGGPTLTRVVGDVADPDHRSALAVEVERLGRLDLLVHNASTLGPVPLRSLRDVSQQDLARTWQVNAAAPLALTCALLPWLRAAAGVVIALSSDAAIEHYPTWGAYGASKAALDHLTLTLGAEEGLTTYAVHAPGRLPRRRHLGSSGTGDRRPGVPRAAAPTASIGPLPSDRARTGGGVTCRP